MKIEREILKAKKARARTAWLKKNKGVPETREQARARLICRRLR